MLYRRTGFPDVDEIVLCQVTQLFPNSVFVDIQEYRRQGMVHISEIAPGRIRNLREYVSEGRQIICKVLRIDREKGHIDLSLRRVNSKERGEKLEEIKQELKAEQLIKNLAKKLGKKEDQLYAELTGKLFQEYSHLYLVFREVVEGAVDLVGKGLEPTLAQELTTAVLDKFKPKKIQLKAEVALQTYSSDGVERVKSTLMQIQQLSPSIKMTYLGGGRYQLIVEDLDYKPAEKTLERVEGLLEGFRDKLSTAALSREKKD